MIRELLNKLKWGSKQDLAFDALTVYYESRGEINDMGFIQGNEIIEIGKHFLETTKGSIPYHRIRKIEHKGKILFPNQETDIQ